MSSVAELPKDLYLTPEEVKMIQAALRAARSDIWQTARVTSINLKGVDLNFPDDAPMTPGCTWIHEAGLKESLRVHEQVSAAVTWLARKLKEDSDGAVA